jgi:hypothetical protein
VNPYEPGVDAEEVELVAHIFAEWIVTDLRENCRTVPQPGRGYGDVGGAPTDGLREGLRVEKACTSLIRIQVNGDATDGDELER